MTKRPTASLAHAGTIVDNLSRQDKRASTASDKNNTHEGSYLILHGDILDFVVKRNKEELRDGTVNNIDR